MNKKTSRSLLKTPDRQKQAKKDRSMKRAVNSLAIGALIIFFAVFKTLSTSLVLWQKITAIAVLILFVGVVTIRCALNAAQDE